MKPSPFRIEPTFSPRIWGTRSLAPIFPEKTNLAEPVGEAWLTDVQCRIANGPFAGKTLGEVWSEIPPEWRGARCAAMRDFPLLVKFIFPTDKLSIQVHPDDAYASVHEVAAGSRGKTEMWHAVSAEPDAKLLLGLKRGVTKREFEAKLGSNSLEDLFQEISVEQNDTFFVPARTPHSIGPGVVMCEVQEYSDLTYRLYDYGRVDLQGKTRQLHIEKALQVIEFDGPVHGKVPSIKWGADNVEVSPLAACRYFETFKFQFDGLAAFKSDHGAFHQLVFLAGYGEIVWDGGRAPYQRGECWFVPALMERCEFLPSVETTVLRTHVPDSAELSSLREQLRLFDISDEHISKVVFD